MFIRPVQVGWRFGASYPLYTGYFKAVRPEPNYGLRGTLLCSRKQKNSKQKQMTELAFKSIENF